MALTTLPCATALACDPGRTIEWLLYFRSATLPSGRSRQTAIIDLSKTAYN
jgi:hypothetical protein